MTLSTVLSAAACALAGAALAVSLTHAGPRGSQGPAGQQGQAGQTGRNAEVAHLGICFETGPDDGGWATAYSPALTDGVPSCPIGQFISVVPQP